MSDQVFSKNVRRHLWLDLEDTIITPVMTGWFNTEIINLEKIKTFINEFNPDQVHIFSFAIWNNTERGAFNQGTRPMLEAALGVRFTDVPTVDDDIIPACCRVMGIDPGGVDFSEMSNFWGKQGAFRLSMLHLFKTAKMHGIETEVVLLDDAVFNEEFHFVDARVRGRILNIDQL